MDYPVMILPFEVKDFSKLSKEKTEEFFDWFIKEKPIRISILKNFFFRFEGNQDIFDYSVTSLNAIWKWYLENVVIEQIDEEDSQEKSSETCKHILTKKLGSGWTQIAWDIGIYFSLCLLEYSPVLTWGVQTEPSDLLSVNRPAVLGFLHNDSFEPFYMMMVLTKKVVKGNASSNSLSDLYYAWIESVPENKE